MSAFSDTWENNLADHIWRAVALTFPGTYYIALFTAAPGEAGGGTEVTGGAYARQGVTRATGSWSAASNGLVDNAALISFPTATANWGTVTHVGVLDALTAGVLIMYAALTTSRTVNSGEQAQFAIGALDLSIA